MSLCDKVSLCFASVLAVWKHMIVHEPYPCHEVYVHNTVSGQESVFERMWFIKIKLVNIYVHRLVCSSNSTHWSLHEHVTTTFFIFQHTYLLLIHKSAYRSFCIVGLFEWLPKFNSIYRKTSNISRTSVGNKIVDHSDVVGASPVGAAPTTSSFSTQHLASMDWAKTTARGCKKHLCFGTWCDLY